MSKSNASAKSRRAFISPPVQSIGASRVQSAPMQPPPSSTTGLTLQQVISVLDKRIVNLEAFVNESKDDSGRRVAFEDDSSSSIPTNLEDIISEFNSRFELFAEEINNMKDIVLKLQTYTMDVNKMLMDERINIFSDLGTITPETNFIQLDQSVTTDLLTIVPGATVSDLRHGAKTVEQGTVGGRFAEPSGTSGSNLDRSKIGLERSGIVGVPKELNLESRRDSLANHRFSGDSSQRELSQENDETEEPVLGTDTNPGQDTIDKSVENLVGQNYRRQRIKA